MRQSRHLYISFILIFVLAALHYLGSTFYFYWTVGWFDYMMHLLGGMALGFFLIYILGTTKRGLVASFLILILIGGLWEVFEYSIGSTFATEGYIPDTFHDLLMDIFGVSIAIYMSRRNNNFLTSR